MLHFIIRLTETHPHSPRHHCLGPVLGQLAWETAAPAQPFQPCPTPCDPTDGSPPGAPPLGCSRQQHLGRLEESYSRSSSYPGHFATRGSNLGAHALLGTRSWWSSGVLASIPALPGQPCRCLGLPLNPERACAPSCHVTLPAPPASLQGSLDRLLSRAEYDASLNRINEKLDC